MALAPVVSAAGPSMTSGVTVGLAVPAAGEMLVVAAPVERNGPEAVPHPAEKHSRKKRQTAPAKEDLFSWNWSFERGAFMLL